MSELHPKEASLRQLVRDARAEKPADVDWSGVEERLMKQVSRTAPAPRRSAHLLGWGALAVAAALAVWFVSQRTPVVAPVAKTPAAEIAEPLRRNGDAMSLGTRVVTAEREVSVDHAGRATWTLAPNSSASLLGNGDRITVHLDRGSVLSQVVPNPKPETFVIEAADARIAVHGTVFRVALENGRVIVQVREGTVAVGPLGAAPAFLLKAPAHGDFSRDGRSGSIDGRQLGASEARRTEPLKLSPSRASTSATAGGSAAPAQSAAELPREPSINDIELGIVRVVDAASDCFRRHTQSAEGVQITVRTALSLKILPSGAVSDVDFQPPLSPDAEACAADTISRIAFAPSEQGANVTRMLELER